MYTAKYVPLDQSLKAAVFQLAGLVGTDFWAPTPTFGRFEVRPLLPQ